MPNNEVLDFVQSFTARRAVGPSAVRSSRKGTAKMCREFLCELDLSKFGTSDSAKFAAALDRATSRLESRLRAKHKWGLARKVLNIFLRDSFYTTFLCDAYNLARAKQLFEMPLDSITAAELRKKYDGPLPRWRGVKWTDSELSRSYQGAALKVATDDDLPRVHLDALWWSKSRDKEKRAMKGA
jgi:hypothetical protein